MSESPLSGGDRLPSPVPGQRLDPSATTRGADLPGPILSHSRSDDAPPSPPAGSAGGTTSTDTESGEGVKKRRRRGSRGGRRKRRSSGEGTEPVEESGAPSEVEDSDAAGPDRDEAGSDGKQKRGRRGSRGGRRRTKAKDDEDEPAETSATTSRRSLGAKRKSTAAAEEADREDDDEPKRRKRGSRGGRRRKKKVAAAVGVEVLPGEDEDDLPELNDLPDDAVELEDEAGGRKKRGKRTKAKKTKTKATKAKRSRRKKDEDDEPELPAPPKKRVILVNAGDPEEKRVAVVEDGRIAELQMTVRKHTSYVSDIYRGRVVNIESAIGAAFVDFGQGRNGFLHASDILPSYGDADWSLERLLSTPVEADAVEADAAADEDDDEGEAEGAEPTSREKGKGRRDQRRPRQKRVRVPIDKLVKKGQMVAVQITKDAIGDKGPTLTTYVSIPGRYLVLMPSLERTGVSRKIDDDKERRRLKKILSSLDIPDGMGVIVRTAGVGKTKTEIKRDLDYLLLAWEDFAKRLKAGRNPAPLYQESDVAIRTMRDLFTSETESVIVDDEAVHERMVEFARKLMPEAVERIRRHEGARPLFQSHGVEQDFEKIFSRRVELPSGGSIVIDQTEALVAIDVNSGRTREAGAEFEDIALKTNLEAAPEIARQIRLRDLGGIIVLDYIDMLRSGSRRAVEKATRDLLKRDRARSKIGRISQFGLLELTRQRLGPGLNKLVYDTCLRCRGSGRRRNASSRAQAILRRLGASLALKGFTTVEVRAHADVIEYLQKELKQELRELEESSNRKLVLMAAPDQVEDSVLHYLRADGREVRPGGRRKR